MIRTLVLLALLATTSFASSPQDSVDLMKKKITKAETIYTTELAKAQTETIKWMDSRDAAARKKGDKATVNLVKLQREKLDVEGTIPRPCPINISRKIDTARDMLDATYAALLKEALMLKLDDLADELESKRVELAKDKPSFKLVTYMSKNMVENGSFEFPEVPNGVDHVESINNGWSDIGVTARFKGAVPIHGNQFLQFIGKTSQQVGGFVPGERYVATAYVATFASPSKSNASCTVSVMVAGEKETRVVTATNKGSKNGYAMPGSGSKWEQITLVFKALEDTHELSIVTEEPTDWAVNLDQVSILPYVGD